MRGQKIIFLKEIEVVRVKEEKEERK